jgi:hypothetical protein
MGISGNWAKGLLGAAALCCLGSAAFADEYTARYDQSLLNGDSVLNGAVLSGAWQSSFASSLINELGVMDRPRQDYEAKGLPLGGFRLYPVLDVAGGVTDNVFATSSATDSADFLEVAPSLALRSQWGRDSLSFYGGSQTTLYDKFSSENMTNWDVGSAGRVDILGDTDVRANVYYDGLHEPRTSPDEPGFVAKPTAFNLFHSDAAIDHKPNRIGITVGAAYDDYHYDNTPLIGGGFLDNSGRNEDILTVYSRLSYDFSPGYTAFIGASYEDRNFLKNVDIAGFDRDSTGYHVDAGAQFFISHLIQGQVFAGYLTQDFKSTLTSSLPNVNALDYGANINWYVTPLMTIHFGAARTIDDTTLASASASDDQTVYGSVDYELLRNVIVQGQVGYSSMKFVGIARTDKVPTAGAEVTWLIDHNLSLNAQYQYSHRSSDAVGEDYSQNTFMIGLKSQL